MATNNDILWIFSATKPDDLPSYVVSGILPAEYLNIKKVVFLKNHNPQVFLDFYKPKILVIGKPLHSTILDLVKEAKRKRIKVLSTFDDWNFLNETEEDAERNKLNNLITNYSDNIVVKTISASKIIENQIGIKAIIIPDCIRFSNDESIKKIDYPFKISWFGMWTNRDTLKYGLKEIINSDYASEVNVISNKLLKLNNYLSELDLKKIKIKFTEWTPRMEKEVIKSDIVIVPYINDAKRIVKSQNRVTDSMSMGRFVIASNMPFLDEFKNYCFLGNIGEGLKWINNNKEATIKKAKFGKLYADEKFSVKNISNQWMHLIKKTLDQV